MKKTNKVKNWLLSAKQNLEALSITNERNIKLAQAQALVSIAEDVDSIAKDLGELVGLVREPDEQYESAWVCPVHDETGRECSICGRPMTIRMRRRNMPCDNCELSNSCIVQPFTDECERIKVK